MSNESVHGNVGGSDQGRRGVPRTFEEQMQNLMNMMTNMGDRMTQMETTQQQFMTQIAQQHPIANEDRRGDVNDRRGDVVDGLGEGGGDNFARVGNYPRDEFRAPRGLECVKLQMPTFAGGSSVDDYLDWESKAERVFECYEIEGYARVRIAAVEFTGYAALWWKNVNDTRRVDGDPEIRTWQEMKRVLRRRFVPEYYQHELYMRLQTLRQGSMTVEEYIKEFEILKIRSGAVEHPGQTLARFVTGLRAEIACVVELQPYNTLGEAIQLALKVERQRRTSANRTSSYRYDSTSKSYRSDNKSVGKNSYNRNVEKTTTVAEVKGERDTTDRGKVIAGADKKQDVGGTSGGKSRQIKCFKCLGIGHIASQCPNKRVMAVVEAVSEDETVDEEEAEDLSALLDEYYGIEDAEEHGDVGDDPYVTLNVLRRTLATTPSREEEQRENLFHISCRVNGHRCALIIDGGSCTNVVAATLVEKLKLTTNPHPKPYKLHWLNDQGSLHVTQRARVPFSVGEKYQDVINLLVIMP